MNREQKRGVQYSTILHVTLLLLFIVGLPSFFFPDPEIEEPTAITVDILPIAPISNVRPSQSKPAEKVEKKEEKKEVQEKPLEPPKPEKEKPSPQVKTADEKPTPPPEATKPDENVVKKEEEKKEEEKEKPKDDPLDAILKSVKDTAAQKTSEQTPEKAEAKDSSSDSKSRSNRFDPNAPEAIAIRDAIQSQIYKCWNVPAGARDADKLIIPLQVDYDKLGNPEKIEIAPEGKGKYGSDPFFRAAADSAIRAIRACSPLQGLPPDSYHIWQYIDMNFNPRDMLL